MIRFGFLLAFLIFSQAQADAAEGQPFQPALVRYVYADALGFIAPRILTPVPTRQLTVWGLQSLSSLDPALQVVARGGRVRLLHRSRTLLDIATPGGERSDDWARVAAEVTRAAVDASTRLRRIGTQDVMAAFFAEMLGHLDPYSRYVAPQEASQDRANRSDKAGLGLEISQGGGTIEVVHVARDSPASIAGIHPGDILVSVDGQRTARQDAGTIADLLAGPAGSSVTLVWHGRDNRSRSARLTRMVVAPETVFARRMAGILLLRITSFGGTTASHIAQSIQEAANGRREISGLILDLRDNGGGLLRQAVTAADTFLNAGLIATTIGRDPDANNIWHSIDGELAEDVPVIVLVDGHTASAAEVLAAALADRGRAVVVGSGTVGKGMVQTIDMLPDGGELFVTWSQILAPLGWPLQGLGVLPQVCTSRGAAALRHQLASLSAGHQPMLAALHRERRARLPVPQSEIVATRAQCPAATGRAADIDTARRLIDNPAAYAAALFPPFSGS